MSLSSVPTRRLLTAFASLEQHTHDAAEADMGFCSTYRLLHPHKGWWTHFYQASCMLEGGHWPGCAYYVRDWLQRHEARLWQHASLVPSKQ